MYHYTYLIQHKKTIMRYIGVRSSKVPPVEDIGYWGSSKHLPKDVHITHSKIILKVFSTRKEALEHEIELHIKNNVALCNTFYNKAVQTSTGFDTTGTLREFSDSHRANLSKSIKRHASSSSYKNPRKGVELSTETKEKISISKKADQRPLYIKSPKFSPWFISEKDVTHLFYDITKDEYDQQHGYRKGFIRDSCTRSKGIRKLARGAFKGKIVGNIPVTK